MAQASNEVITLEPVSDLADETKKRERSTIEFPYTDLLDAETIAKGVHALGGSVEWNTLAGHLKATPDGGGFRSRMSAARMFGLLDWDKANVKLTDLGMRICDRHQEKIARVEAFLMVPLYAKVYEQFSGKTLPPTTGLESLMQTLGVASMQKERARQAFQRCAKEAGFFDFGPERLVKPAISKQDTPPPPPPTHRLPPAGQKRIDGTYDPLIEGLLNRLPPPDGPWSMEARKKWLQAALTIFDVMYVTPDGEKAIVIEFKQEGK